jgi:SulP family sulfate permease
LLHRLIPISQDISRYRPEHGRRDVLAGVTVAALAIPSAMAYGESAGLTPANGLYALLLPCIAYALLGSSKRLVIGPEASIAALAGAAVVSLAVAGSPEAEELAGMLAILVGGCFFLAWFLRLGWIADYFSRPVLIGYVHGVAIVLIIGQFGKLLGLSIDATDPLPQLREVVSEIEEASGATIAVGAATLVILLPLRYLAPRFPAPLLVVLGGILVSWLLDFEDTSIAFVGDIPAGLPHLTVPTPPASDLTTLLPAAVGIFAVSFADAILTARSVAGARGGSVRAGQEILAFAGANSVGGLTQGFPIGASGSRTATNEGMGARTQVAAAVAAAMVALILLFLTEPMSYLPKAVLGAVIVSAAVGLVDRDAWRGIWTVNRVEAAIAGVTLVGVVAVGVLEALILAVALTIFDAIRRSARPHDAVLGWSESRGGYVDVSFHPSAEITPGVVVYRLDDRLFFANAHYTRGRVKEAVNASPTEVRWLIFDGEAMTHIDVTGLEELRALARDLRREGVTLVFARLKEGMRARLQDAGLTETPGLEHFYPTVRAAVEACTASQPNCNRERHRTSPIRRTLGVMPIRWQRGRPRRRPATGRDGANSSGDHLPEMYQRPGSETDS